MIFHSIDFGLVFFPLLFLYWISPHRIQNLLLLVFSYFFYSYSEPWYALLLFGTTAVTYLVSLRLEKEEVRASKKLSRLYLAIGLGVPMSLLIFFKYAKFFADNLSVATTSFGLGGLTVPAYLLPVGISFFTFHSASYVFDVYRRDVQAAKKFRDYALFLSFFPQLVAGPITRSWALLPQVTQERKVQLAAIRPALTLIMWGYLKKLVIADNLAVITNKVFALQNPSFVLLWVGVLSFGMQIYSDFSAYTDIARGVSRLLGFELAENFKHPYLALSPTEFWRRWHISLSTWFRDYLYIPLGGSRGSFARTAWNTFLTFLICGFWHGASWNYIIWGGYHGILLVISRLAADKLGWLKVPNILKWLITFILMQIGWLFFRETNLTQLIQDLTLSPFANREGDGLIAIYFFAVVFFLSLPLFIQPAAEKLASKFSPNSWQRLTLEIVFTGASIAACMTFFSRSPSDFIYFQF